VRTVPSSIPAGSHELQLQDSKGGLLRRIAFEPALVADLPEGQELRHFAFAVALDPAAQANLHRLSVRQNSMVLAERETTLAPGADRAVREPVAVSMRPAVTHLSWDREVHRKVMVRDPRTGEVIAFLEGGSGLIESDAKELEFTFSDGVRSERRILKVME